MPPFAPPIGLVVAPDDRAGDAEHGHAALPVRVQVERRAQDDPNPARLEPTRVERDHREVLGHLGRVDDADGQRPLRGARQRADHREDASASRQLGSSKAAAPAPSTTRFSDTASGSPLGVSELSSQTCGRRRSGTRRRARCRASAGRSCATSTRSWAADRRSAPPAPDRRRTGAPPRREPPPHLPLPHKDRCLCSRDRVVRCHAKPRRAVNPGVREDAVGDEIGGEVVVRGSAGRGGWLLHAAATRKPRTTAQSAHMRRRRRGTTAAPGVKCPAGRFAPRALTPLPRRRSVRACGRASCGRGPGSPPRACVAPAPPPARAGCSGARPLRAAAVTRIVEVDAPAAIAGSPGSALAGRRP